MIDFSPTEWAAIRLSLWAACWAVVIALPIAVWVATILARGTFWGHSALNVIVHLPLVLPPVVTGYVLLLLFGRFGPIGGWLDGIGLRVAFHPNGVTLAAGIMAFPLMVRALRLGFEGVDAKLVIAASSLGASPLAVFWYIKLPLMRGAILAAIVLGFAKALGEFGATITLVSNIPGQTQTLPSAIYAALQVPGQEGVAIKLVIISVLLSVAALVASEIFVRRGRF